MLWSSILAATLVGGPGQPTPTVTIVVDSSKKELTITAGPYNLPNMPPMENHAMMDFGMSHDTPIQEFDWPLDGWFRGFRLELTDAQGRPVPRGVIHHMIMVNFSRRQLVYPAVERLMGAGTETGDLSVPKTIGVPMTPGMKLGMYVAWHNDTGKDLEGVQLKIVMFWTPKNQNPRPVNSLPIYMDVNLTVGGTNTFDVPPGVSEKAHEFTVPVSGRILGIGGHLHDYGVRVRLEDAETGKIITQVEATRDSAGKVSKVSQHLFGVSGEGLKLKANHRYRVVGVYDNPTGETLVRGAMAHMAGLFVPDDIGDWPRIDTANGEYRRDIAALQVRGTGDAGHDHGTAAAQEPAAADGHHHGSGAEPQTEGHTGHESGAHH